MKAYPRLEDTGGFEILRAVDGGSKRPVKKIEVEWYDVQKIAKKEN